MFLGQKLVKIGFRGWNVGNYVLNSTQSPSFLLINGKKNEKCGRNDDRSIEWNIAKERDSF